MMPWLEQTLYSISNAILLPILIAVLGLFAWTIVLAGGLLREWIGRRNVRRTLRELRALAQRQTASHAELLRCLSACPNGLPARFSQKLRTSPDIAERTKCLEDVELEVASSLSQLAWITRIAPMLGLMGTLIPLGPALTGLASGDIAKLSSNLVVAFTTTVLGVFLGCASFSMSLLRKNWYNRDLSDLEHVFTHSQQTVADYAEEKA
jgi:biopolymer transport protein ExbB/TolQ